MNSTENLQTMTEETVATQADTKGNERTFTQDELNRIVQDRLAKDRAKASEEMEKKEKELAQREFLLNSRHKLIDRGLPEKIIDALNCSSDEAFDKALDLIDELLKERTPSKEIAEAQREAAARAPRYTAPLENNRTASEDFIRRAMKL